MTDDRRRMTEVFEFGIVNAEWGIKKGEAEKLKAQSNKGWRRIGIEHGAWGKGKSWGAEKFRK